MLFSSDARAIFVSTDGRFVWQKLFDPALGYAALHSMAGGVLGGGVPSRFGEPGSTRGLGGVWAHLSFAVKRTGSAYPKPFPANFPEWWWLAPLGCVNPSRPKDVRPCVPGIDPSPGVIP